MTERSPGDPLELLSDLARTERSALAAVARAEGVSAEDAVECVQEALCTLLVMTRQSSAPTPSEWPPVLTGMVRNAARNRRRRHFRARPHDALEESALADPHAVVADELIARAEEHVRLRACVEDLCEIQKAVVTLRLLEEQPGQDVARALGISTNHVAVLLHRAKAALRACMTS
jgi:RNA polymerase sigma factor (sigma-70 family)